jgi:ankyrin repeat protein
MTNPVQRDFNNALLHGKECAMIRKYVKRGANVNALVEGETPVFIAAKNGHVDAIKTLIGFGANVNTQINDGYTPVFIAAEEGHVDAIKILVGFGASSRNGAGAGAIWPGVNFDRI